MKKTTIAAAAFFLVLTFLLSCKPEMKMEPAAPSTRDEHEGMLTLTEGERLLSGIKSDSARVKNISEVTTLVGKTAFDERLVNVLTARVGGRLDELYVRNPGEFLKKGQPVYAIYSEELLAAENDFLLALDKFNSAVAQKEIARLLLDAARKKLALWKIGRAHV